MPNVPPPKKKDLPPARPQKGLKAVRTMKTLVVPPGKNVNEDPPRVSEAAPMPRIPKKKAAPAPKKGGQGSLAVLIQKAGGGKKTTNIGDPQSSKAAAAEKTKMTTKKTAQTTRHRRPKNDNEDQYCDMLAPQELTR